MAKKQKFPTGMSDTFVDAPPAVVRAHAIADTIKALRDCEAFDVLQNEQRNEVAKLLRVPALWVDAAQDRETVNLEMIREFNDWFAALGAGRAVR